MKIPFLCGKVDSYLRWMSLLCRWNSTKFRINMPVTSWKVEYCLSFFVDHIYMVGLGDLTSIHYINFQLTPSHSKPPRTVEPVILQPGHTLCTLWIEVPPYMHANSHIHMQVNDIRESLSSDSCPLKTSLMYSILTQTWNDLQIIDIKSWYLLPPSTAPVVYSLLAAVVLTGR